MNNKSYSLDRDAFENHDQIDEYVSCLRRRMLPLKFAYIGPAAHTHDKLVRSKEYGLADAEAQLIQDNLISFIVQSVDEQKLNILDIGSGNGLKGAQILRLIKTKISDIRYAAFDYSQELLKIAVNNILSLLPELTINTCQIDFETSSIRQGFEQLLQVGGKNLFLLLGNTIGNPSDRIQTLRNIRNSMNMGDLLLVGFELFHSDRIQDILAHYQNQPFYDAVFNPLTFAGIVSEDGVLDVTFNHSTHNVEVHFRLAKNLTIQIPDGSSLEFKANESILIFLSHRFTLVEFQEVCSKLNLQIVNQILNEHSTYSLITATAI